MMTQQPQNQQEYYSKVLYDLAVLVLNMIQSSSQSTALSDGDSRNQGQRRQGPSFDQITPSGFASLLMGTSLALMLGGSVTFFLGFLLMPWVLGFLVLLCLVGIISSFSMIWKAIMFHNCLWLPPPTEKIASWKYL